MNKKISLGAALAYMAIVAAITFSLTSISSMDKFNSMMRSIDERENTYDKLAEIDLFVRDYYYGPLDNDIIMASTAAGYISGLGDANSRYMTAKEYEEYTNVETGRYVGIGVVTELSEDGYIRLKTVYPESPAEYVGLKAGDIILSVDGEPAKAENYNELTAGLRGDAGTKVTLVKRLDNSETPLELTRRDVDIPTIESQMIGNIGYLRFTGITQATATQMDKTIRLVTESGAASLIFDLRGINSSSVEYITTMLDSLMPEGDIAMTRDKDGETQVIAVSDSKEVSLPITVLADEKTSGATELFALVIRERPDCKVVGVTTAGAGSLQEPFRLTDGSAVLLTTAIYTSASGSSYDGTGVAPDYDVKLDYPEENKANIMGNTELDTQLRKAIEICEAAAKTVVDSALSSQTSTN